MISLNFKLYLFLKNEILKIFFIFKLLMMQKYLSAFIRVIFEICTINFKNMYKFIIVLITFANQIIIMHSLISNRKILIYDF